MLFEHRVYENAAIGRSLYFTPPKKYLAFTARFLREFVLHATATNDCKAFIFTEAR